jgi:hypothetical protein
MTVIRKRRRVGGGVLGVRERFRRERLEADYGVAEEARHQSCMSESVHLCEQREASRVVHKRSDLLKKLGDLLLDSLLQSI